MVASDVGVQVEPNTLDAVGVGTIGGQEVQDDTAAQLVEQSQHGASLVHAIVVDDEMDAACTWVAGREKSQQVAKEGRALLVCPGRVQIGPHRSVSNRVEWVMRVRRYPVGRTFQLAPEALNSLKLGFSR